MNPEQLYCIDSLSTLHNIKSVSFDVNIPHLAFTENTWETESKVGRLIECWTLVFSLRSHNPSREIICFLVIEGGGILACTRSPITGRKLWCSYCGSIPKCQRENGNHENCASSANLPGNRCLALVPKPSNMAGRINPVQPDNFILGSNQMVTFPGRRLRVGSAPCSCPLVKKKWTRLKLKWSPLKGPVLVPFWPLHCGKSVEAFISSRS